MAQFTLTSPLGPLSLEASDEKIVALHWDRAPSDDPDPVLREAAAQLGAYFAGERRTFDLPAAPRGTAFQKRLWAALAEIPYGETRTYGEIARRLGTSARAVGRACGANPLPIILPCHRVVAANGGSGGYSGKGGVNTKAFLLALELRNTRLL